MLRRKTGVDGGISIIFTVEHATEYSGFRMNAPPRLKGIGHEVSPNV